MIMQQKTHRPVQFEITEQTRESLGAWISQARLNSDQYLSIQIHLTNFVQHVGIAIVVNINSQPPSDVRRFQGLLHQFYRYPNRLPCPRALYRAISFQPV